jgi:hypothetical protein
MGAVMGGSGSSMGAMKSDRPFDSGPAPVATPVFSGDRDKAEVGGGGAGRTGGGACEAYAACTSAMGAAYRKAGYPDAAKSMEDVGEMMLEMKGPSADSSCEMALGALTKNADMYEKMPKFTFPRAACGM